MARKRMFDLAIINQDSFYELPMDAKALYFLLGMEADDEGFVNPKKIIRLYGGSEDSIKILIAKQYIIPFKSGVVVITDWKRNNYIDKNKMKETIYIQEKENVTYNEKTQKYEQLNQSLNPVKLEFTQSSVVESSLDKSNSSSVDNLYNPEVEKLQKIMIETIGTTNTNNIMECVGYLEKLPIELIEYALRKTARIERPSWKYAIPILDSYVKNGFKTIEEVQADDLKHKSKNIKTETKQENIRYLPDGTYIKDGLHYANN